jgi:hypothetical protein
MSGLRGSLQALADRAPEGPMPPGLFDRARRRRRRRYAAAALTVVVLVLSGYGLSVSGPLGLDRRGPEYAAGPPGLPDRLFDPPRWTQEFSGSPNGPASVLFRGPGIARPAFGGFGSPVAIVSLTGDVYRIAYPAEPPALSPDGRTLLESRLEGGRHTVAVDLATGESRPLGRDVMPVAWSVDGRHALLVHWNQWNQTGPVNNDMTVHVVGWPSGQTEWSVAVERPDPLEGETNFFIALSPDASMLAVTTSRELRVYDRNGQIRWRRTMDNVVLGGPAAWRADGRLAILRRDLPTACDGCPARGWFQPSGWSLEFVDVTNGEEAAGPAYPAVRDAYAVRIVAWRGDTPYAVVRRRSEDDDLITATLVRLQPGAATPQDVLSPAPDTEDLAVATDYVDAIRPAGRPEFGFSIRQVISTALPVIQIVVLVAGVILILWWRRRTRRRRSAGQASGRAEP